MVANGKFNLVNERTKQRIPNQFIILDERNIIFQSYNSMIVRINSALKKIYVYPDYNYSKTTNKYRNQFMDSQGFHNMATLKGFREALEAGKVVDNQGKTWLVKLKTENK